MAHMLITGGTGFIGRQLCLMAQERGIKVTVMSRQAPANVRQLLGSDTGVITTFEQLASLPPIDIVVNLAGEPILNGRWNSQRKQRLRDSRIDLTRHLVSTLATLSHKPQVMISGSAIGFYGDAGDQRCDETTGPGQGFAATLCKDWERSAQPVTALKTRLCLLRIGVVLDSSGGPLQKMLLPFKLGLGGRLGTGQQWFSWISRTDLCNLIFFLIDNNKLNGVFNGTAPEPVRNEFFTRQLAHALRRPAALPMPEWLIKTGLGEAAEVLLGSQRVMPAAAMAAGFEFQHPTLDQALDTLRKN